MSALPAGLVLDDGEDLLWSGPPTRGFVGSGQTVWTVILFGLPAIAWIAFALDTSQSPATAIPALLSVFLPVFAIRDWHRRQRTTYVLTTLRAIIMLGERIAREIRFGPQPAPSLQGNAILFDGIPRVRFESLIDPKAVAAIAEDAWRRAR